nr:uncharacterized protein LOC118878240 isoform X2 [Drosophila suzukii]XP_036675996.1 uncharacterized protein LOC118878240 isoform X2 [Drosophila suzukii]
MSDEENIESPVFEKLPVMEATPEDPTAAKENGAPAADSGALSGAVDGEKATAEAADKEEESAADAVGPVKRKVDDSAAKADEAGATPEKKAKMEEECTKDEV